MDSRKPQRRISRWVVGGVGLLLAAALFRFFTPAAAGPPVTETPEAKPIAAGARLAPGTTDTLDLSEQLLDALDLRTHQVKQAESRERLRLSGSLFLDSNRMVRVHSRFSGEVVSIGPLKEGADPATDPAGARPLRMGDKVKKDQLVAVIWSKDVGEKKSDLVNATSQYYLDKAQLDRLKSLPKGVVPERTVREAERQFEADVIAVDRVERTLRSWRLTDEEIAEVRGEAEKIHDGDRKPNMAVEKTWAEVDVRAPFDGVVLEKNITTGDIVDTNLDLFKIADLRKLGALANVYEEDLPALEALPREKRQWTIQLKAQPNAPGIHGEFDLIGNVIDPSQHTAAIMGWLDNSDGRLRVGQFITATVKLAAGANEVAVPESALVDEGNKNIVFVASDASGRRVMRRHVSVARRGQDLVFIRAEPRPGDCEHGCQPLRSGEYVVTNGVVELACELDKARAALDPADSKK